MLIIPLILSFNLVSIFAQYCDPYAVRVSIGYYYTYQNLDQDQLDIQYNTNSSCPNSHILIDGNKIAPVETKLLDMGSIYEGTNQTFTYKTYIHRVQLGNLVQGKDYTYQVFGDDTSGKSIGPYIVRAPIKKDQNPKRIVFFGDMDSQWIQNNSRLSFDWFIDQTRHNRTAYDLFIFNGDLAYDLESDDCQRGDYFLRNLSTFTPYIPMLVVPGNHDDGQNQHFDYLKASFYTPEKTQMNTPEYFYNFYSFDLGLAHFINFHPYWMVYQTATKEQYQILVDALRNDLMKAKLRQHLVPWIVVYSHYPIYCSNAYDEKCRSNHITLKPFTDLFQEYGVHYLIGAHQHSYERDAPTIDNKTAQFETESLTQQHYIKNSTAPVYIVEGVAGNDYFMAPKPYPNQQYTVAQTVQIGMGILTIVNRTHLLFQQIAAKNNEILDYVYVVRDDNQPESSNKTLWIWIAVISSIVILLGIGGIAYYYNRKNKKTYNLDEESSMQKYQDQEN